MKLGFVASQKDAQSQKKELPDICSGANSYNVKGQLQAVACIHATPTKSSNPIEKG